jgi:predicted aspartyl protease
VRCDERTLGSDGPRYSRFVRATTPKRVLCSIIFLQMIGIPLARSATNLPPQLNPSETSAASLPPGAEAPPIDEPLYASPTRRDRIGRVVAPVMVDGLGPYRFVVDTGATHSVVSGKLARALGLAGADTEPVAVELSGVTGTMMVDTVPIGRLQAGDLVIEDRRLPVINAVLEGADGVLGVDGLEDKRVIIDFRHDRIQILKSSRRAPSGYLVVPVKLGFNRLLIADGFVGHVRVKAIIDTGSERTLGNYALKNALKIGTDPRHLPVMTSVEGVTADLQPGEVARAPGITLGESTVNEIVVTYGDLHVFQVWGLEKEPAIVVGMDALGTLSSLVIDYRRKEIQMLPYDVPLTVRYVSGRLSR